MTAEAKKLLEDLLYSAHTAPAGYYRILLTPAQVEKMQEVIKGLEGSPDDGDPGDRVRADRA